MHELLGFVQGVLTTAHVAVLWLPLAPLEMLALLSEVEVAKRIVWEFALRWSRAENLDTACLQEASSRVVHSFLAI